MMRLRGVFLSLGIMTTALAVAMVPSALLDIASGRPEWPAFTVSAFMTGVVGASLWVLASGAEPKIGRRESFLTVVLIWTILPAIAAVPFTRYGMSVTDSWFESVSGLTTTGATVLTGLDDLPQGLLLWRAVLQWFGGIGIIVTAIAVLPQLRVGGMQLFKIESSERASELTANVRQTSQRIGLIYLGLTALCALLYNNTGMNAFNAITHAMTTVAAGGYSTHDTSFFVYQGTPVIWVAIVFMMIAGLPFTALEALVFKNNSDPLLTGSEPRTYLSLILAITAIILVLFLLRGLPAAFGNLFVSVDDVLFSVVSVMTGTGYASAPYDTWGDPILIVFLLAIFTGGCAGSAACGMKMFRIEISVKAILAHAQRITRPHRLAPIRFNRKVVDEETLQSVMTFVFLYIATFLFAAVLLSVMPRVDFLTAVSAAATSVSNVGPGLGPVVGPSGTFQTLPDAAKWICASAMLLGRLEFVAVFVILSVRFWRG